MIEFIIIFFAVIWGVAVVEIYKIMLLILSILVPFLGICLMFKHRRDDVENKAFELKYELISGLKRFDDDKNNFYGMTKSKCRDRIDSLENYVKSNEKNLDKKYFDEIIKTASELLENILSKYDRIDKDGRVKILKKIQEGFNKLEDKDSRKQ